MGVPDRMHYGVPDRMNHRTNSVGAVVDLVKPEELVARGINDLRTRIPDIFTDIKEPLLRDLEELDLLLLVPQEIRGEREKLERMARSLRQVVRVLQAGFAPTTPNSKWFCGFVRQWWQHQSEAIESIGVFRSANPPQESRPAVYVFSGVIPVWVQKAYLQANEIFKERDMVIYSPQLENFQEARIRIDPVIIGVVRNVPDRGNMFFEIVRWDTQKDLKSAPKQE